MRCSAVEQIRGRPEVLLERGIPTKKVNEYAKMEKLDHGSSALSLIHYWWTRKPLIVCRTVLLSAIADNITPNELESVAFGSADARTPYKEKTWEKSNTFEIYKRIMARAKEIYGNDLTIYDPFAGSGMIGFEALRMGLNVELSDVNPVAYLIMKATIEYPKKYGSKLLNDVKREGERIIREMREELKDLYPPHRWTDESTNGVNQAEVKAYIWAWGVKCPSCGRVTPLVNDWAVSREEYISYKVEGDSLKFEIKRGKSPEGNVRRGEGRCLFCDMKITNEEIKEDIRENKREVLLAVALNRNKYSADVSQHETGVMKASEILNEKMNELFPYLPNIEIVKDKRNLASSNYLSLWSDLFNDRQKVLVATLAKKIKETGLAYAEKGDREYAKAVVAVLSSWVGNVVNFNSRVAAWQPQAFTMGTSVMNNGIGLMWKHAEPNPLIKFSGSLQNMLENVLTGLKFSIDQISHVKDGNNLTGIADQIGTESNPIIAIRLASALSPPDKKYKLIITDPPYYDDKPYAELSEFFYVWEKPVLEDFFPEAFSNSHVDSSESIDVGGDRTPEMFYARFEAAISNLYDALDDDGLLVMFYAHKNMEVWEKISDMLWKKGFHVTSAIPLSTENENNPVARGKNSVYYSLVMTARKRIGEEATTLPELFREVKNEIIERMSDVKGFNYTQGELFLWGVGVALKVITRYSKIESFSNESVSATALDYAQTVLMDVLLESDMEDVFHSKIALDDVTKFYLLALRGAEKELDYDEFNKLIKASGINEKDLFDRNMIGRKSDGKKARIVIKDAFERAGEDFGTENIKGNSIIDIIHRAIVEFDKNKSFSRVGAYANNNGIHLDYFLDVLILMHRYESAEGSKFRGSKEVETIEKIMEAASKYLPNSGLNLDPYR